MSIRKFAFGAVAAAAMAAAPLAASAATIQLGFILDESGSIGSGNYTIIKNGLKAAIANEIPIGGANTYEISIVSFSTAATTIVNRLLVDDAGDVTAIGNALDADTFSDGLTNYKAAFELMTSLLTTPKQGETALPTTSYVNFATDGDPTAGGSGPQSDPSHDVAGKAARDAMIAAGIDNISIEGIGSGVDASNLKNNYCYPNAGGCDDTSPFEFPSKGFYIGVANAQGYADAIGNKIATIVNVPEPGSLALVGLALAGIGAASRRRKA